MNTETRLNPFTPSDWSAFSGCNSIDPRVAYGDGFVLILDGPGVEFLMDPEGEGPIYSGEFPNEETARRVAYAILASPTLPVVKALLDRWSDEV